MSDIDADHVIVTREEIEALRAAQSPTVTISQDEYRRLKANQSHGIDPERYQRVMARLTELERQLRLEQQEHAAEIADITKRFAHK